MQANGQDLPTKLAIARARLEEAQVYVDDLEAQLLKNQPELASGVSEVRTLPTLDTMLEGCQIIGFDWRYLYLNETAIRHARRPKDELLGHTMMECYPGIENTDMFAMLQPSMRQRTVQRTENQFVHPDGTTVWLELSVQPIPEGILILSLDITERKRSEAATTRYAERIKILHEISLQIIQATSTQEVVDTALKHIRRLIPSQQAGVVLFDPLTNEVHFFALDLSKPSALVKGLHYPMPPGFLEEFGAATVTVIDDMQLLEKPSPTVEQLIREGMRSVLRALLLFQGQPMGVLALTSDTPGYFTVEHRETAAQVADQIAIAIRQMRLSQELERQVQTVDEMRQFLQTTLDAFPANTTVLDANGTLINVNLAWKYYADENESKSTAAYLGSNYLTVCDTSTGPMSEYAAPVAAGIRSVIAGQRDEFYLEYPCHSPTEALWYMLRVTPFQEPSPRRVVVAHINITQRKRAESAVERYAQRMEILREIDRGIINASSIQALVETTLSHLRWLIPCQRTDVTLLDETSGEAVIFAVGLDGDTKLGPGVRVPIPPNVFDGYDEKHVRVFDDIRSFQETRPRAKQLVDEGLVCALSVLLIDKDRPVGVLGLFASTPGFFTAEHSEIAAEIAGQLSIAIHQMHLDEALTRHAAELEQKVVERTVDLNDAKERVEAIFNNTTDGIFLLSADLNIEQRNVSFNRLFACEPDDYLGKSLISLVHADDADAVKDIIKSVFAEKQGKSIEICTVRKDGSVFDSELSIAHIKDDGLVCTLRDITERKAQERQLRYHASLQENVSDAVVVTDMEFRIQSWNRAAERIYGWRAEEVIDKTTADILRSVFSGGDDREGSAQALLQQGWWQGEVIQYHKDGSIRHILGSVTLVRDESGLPFGVVAINHDITDRKRAERALEQNERLLRAVVENLPVGVWILDLDGNITLSNPAGRQIWASAKDVGLNPFNQHKAWWLDTGRRVEADEWAGARAISRGETSINEELEIEAFDGAHKYILNSGIPIRDERGNMLGAITVSQDITERRQVAAELETQRTFLQSVIDVSPSLIFVKDDNARFVLVNPTFAKMYNTTVEALIGKTDGDFNPSLKEVEAYLEADRRVITSGQPLFLEEPITVPNGETRWLQTIKVPISSADGKSRHVLGVATDITERRKSEEILRQTLQQEKELGELKSRFVSMASHEFRTPLATILAVTETLSAYRRKLSEEQIDERIGKIKDQVSHLTDIMDDVLLLARMQARRVEFNPVRLNLDNLCRSVIDEFQSRSDVAHQFIYTCDERLREVRLDKKLMRQIINNLVSNAVKYSPSDKPIKVALTCETDSLIFKLQDEGIGIPEADLKHIFEPFHRAANVGTISGTGLGMVITKEAVELHSGSIMIESKVGTGTTFTVSIPLSKSRGNDDGYDPRD